MKQHAPVEEEIERLFRPFAEKMEKNGLTPLVIDTFRQYYALLARGETGLVSNADIEPIEEGEICDVEKLTGLKEAGQAAVEKLVVIKLNGGLGTSMGLSQAKSLLEVKNGRRFLDIIATQILTYRHKHGVRLPVVFMNSFSTEADTLEALAPYNDLPAR
ncbi:MAG: UTP--glucose-1-phosphate uridylyltransferase, partial [Desulfobacterales bacterium]|nr:UTP--glucose-1-phosphate uridylyltransferase [Desulfobacterales bacterium]